MDKMNDTVRMFLEERRFGVLATLNRDGTVQQTVMWYELQVEDGRIMMNTAEGRVKDGNLHRDPRISICIEDGYRYVTIKGNTELDENAERAQSDIKALATRYEGVERAERMVRNTFSKQKRLTFYLSLDNVDAHGF